MLSTAQGHALFIGTPRGFNDFYTKYRNGQPGALDEAGQPIQGWRSWVFTTLQGGNVPPEEVAEARRTLDARTFRQEYDATFETFAGRVIYAFSRAENVRPCPYDPDLPLHVGIDFNVNPMSATVWQHRAMTACCPDHDQQIGEVVLPSSNTDEICDELQRRFGRHGGVDHITLYPDPAGAQRRSSAQGRTDIGILRARGFRVLAMSSHPLVRDRHNLTNARFCSADGVRRAFVDPGCVKSIEAYERLVYREGTNEPDKTGGYDHLVDGTGYMMFGRYAAKPAHLVPSTHMLR
jgi:hypothetical protein